MGQDRDDIRSGPVLALLERGPVANAVRSALSAEDVEVELRAPDTGRKLWRDARSAPALLVDVSMDPGDVREARELGWIATAAPVFVVAQRLPSRERYISWLEAGAWDVVKIPLESAGLALQLRNILRGRPEEVQVPVRRYTLDAFERVATETLSLASRYERPVHCVAVSLEWAGEESGPPSDVLQRLANEAEQMVRTSDLVGLADRSTVLILLPDTEPAGATVFRERLATVLEQRLEEWGVPATLATAAASGQGTASGFELLNRTLRGLEATPP